MYQQRSGDKLRDTFQVAYIERVLRTQISRMSRFDFATDLVITGFTLQCCDLAVS